MNNNNNNLMIGIKVDQRESELHTRYKYSKLKRQSNNWFGTTQCYLWGEEWSHITESLKKWSEQNKKVFHKIKFWTKEYILLG